MELKNRIKIAVDGVTLKHLQGQHDQKRHGWRYGGTAQARGSMRGRNAEERSEYRKRAGMPEPKKIEKKPPKPQTLEDENKALLKTDQDRADYKKLTDRYGKDNVWHYENLQKHFTVEGFSYGISVVRRKSDGKKGSLDFGRLSESGPRFYYDFVPDR